MGGRKRLTGRRPFELVKARLHDTDRPARAKKKPRAVSAKTPPCPRWLSKSARAEWRRLAPELARLGLLSRLDVAAFVALCCAIADLRWAQDVIEREGRIVDGHRGVRTKHPALTIERGSIEQVRRLSAEFGLTPATRPRVTEAVPLMSTSPTTADEPMPKRSKDRLGRPI